MSDSLLFSFLVHRFPSIIGPIISSCPSCLFVSFSFPTCFCSLLLFVYDASRNSSPHCFPPCYPKKDHSISQSRSIQSTTHIYIILNTPGNTQRQFFPSHLLLPLRFFFSIPPSYYHLWDFPLSTPIFLLRFFFCYNTFGVHFFCLSFPCFFVFVLSKWDYTFFF